MDDFKACMLQSGCADAYAQGAFHPPTLSPLLWYRPYIFAVVISAAVVQVAVMTGGARGDHKRSQDAPRC